MNPRFSIIVPLYNKAPYVRKALDSIVAQTYRDWELIIVDDGSTDNSLEVVKEFVGQIDNRWIDDRLTIISQKNAGAAAARNNGVKASKGDYVAFLDADDWWESEFLEEIDRLIEEYPDAGIYATNYVYYKPGKTRVALNLPRGYMNYPDAYLHSDMMPVTSITTCMPRKVFDEMGGFPLGIKLGEDFLLWAKTAVHYKVAFCEKALAYYNNDVPVGVRATRNLHEPEHHMLFNLAPLEAEIKKQVESGKWKVERAVKWKALLDKLRVGGLMKYWMSEEHHDAAAEELEKVDWSKQPKSVVREYRMPIGYLRAKQRVMHIGSFVKQKIMLVRHRR